MATGSSLGSSLPPRSATSCKPCAITSLRSFTCPDTATFRARCIFTAGHSEDAPALSAEGLAEKLQIYQEGANWPVRLVVLAACNSAAAARLVARHVDCAIGMSNEVGDEELATLFTPTSTRPWPMVERADRL